MEKYYISTAIVYASGKPHIGNIYEIIMADCIARFKRLAGFEVYFQTGTDEHGAKVETNAASAGKEPQDFVDETVMTIRGLFEMMNISYDRFVRTTDPVHKQQIQKMFRRFFEQDDIYKDEYSGSYCVPCESFWTQSQLADGKCPDCGRDVAEAKEEAYFFKMGKYADRLIQHIKDNPGFIRPESRKNEMMNNFLLPGLHDLCVSRTSYKWGIPVDFDEKHVVYVWLDALSNYITGIGYDVDGNHDGQYVKWWPADLHLIGKDIVRFHTIYWPIFLMALGEPLPQQVFGHPWLLMGQDKMSKSSGNLIYADELAAVFGVDAVRYFVLHEMPFDNDGSITWELVTERVNADLANVLGNLVKRTVTMSNKYFAGVVSNEKVNEAVDNELMMMATTTVDRVSQWMDDLRVADALNEVIALFRRCNKYIDETEPWVLAKDESKLPRLATVLYNLVEAISIGATLLAPFMPDTAKRIAVQLGLPLRDFATLGSFGILACGTKVTAEPETLFARHEGVRS
jgi:methionyl-tRNA synthetase